MARTLLLDNSYFPVSVINWQRAMILLITGRAEVVDEYSDVQIRSVSSSFKLPRILRLFKTHKRSATVRFTRYNVFWRDRWTCQYCAVSMKTSKLTFDHVIPRSKGGETSWENVVTACQKCNSKKGCKSLKECNLELLKKPVKPKWSPQMCLKLKEDDPQEWYSWFPRLRLSS